MHFYSLVRRRAEAFDHVARARERAIRARFGLGWHFGCLGSGIALLWALFGLLWHYSDASMLFGEHWFIT